MRTVLTTTNEAPAVTHNSTGLKHTILTDFLQQNYRILAPNVVHKIATARYFQFVIITGQC